MATHHLPAYFTGTSYNKSEAHSLKLAFGLDAVQFSSSLGEETYRRIINGKMEP